MRFGIQGPKKRPPLPGGALWGGVVLLCACSRTVVLGTDCPELDTVCVHQVFEPDAGGDGPLDAEANGDRGGDAPSAPLDEAGANEDAMPDADPLVTLFVDNPDFERNGGIGGDVVLSNLLARIPPISIIFADLPSWYACWALAINSVSSDPEADAGTTPLSGDYLSFVVNGTPVRQKLTMPLKKGATYAFEIEAFSQPDNGAHLFVEVRGADEECGVGTALGRSALLPDDMWTQTCVEFTADTDHDYLLLAPGVEGPDPSPAARLLLDTLRPVRSCSSP